MLGFQNYVCIADKGDVVFCASHTKMKPPPVCQEFTDLAEILMEENQWDIPQDCQEALTLYFNLINSIHE